MKIEDITPDPINKAINIWWRNKWFSIWYKYLKDIDIEKVSSQKSWNLLHYSVYFRWLKTRIWAQNVSNLFTENISARIINNKILNAVITTLEIYNFEKIWSLDRQLDINVIECKKIRRCHLQAEKICVIKWSLTNGYNSTLGSDNDIFRDNIALWSKTFILCSIKQIQEKQSFYSWSCILFP